MNSIASGPLWAGVEQDVSERAPRWGLDFQHAGPTGGVVGGAEVGEAVAVAGAAGEDEFAVGGEFEEGAVGEVGAWAVDLEGRCGRVRGGDDGEAGGEAGGDVRRL